jgi:cytidylate kinase
LRIRALRLAERMGVSVRTARRAARDLDRRRTQFDRTMYRMVSADPHNYDLVLDSNSLGLDIAVEVVVRTVESGRPGAMARPGPGPWTLTPGNQLSTAPEIRVLARSDQTRPSVPPACSAEAEESVNQPATGPGE